MGNHTPGPWEWSLNLTSKCIELNRAAGWGDIVMRPVRWGMNSAGLLFNVDGFLKPVKELGKAIPGREHHAHWEQIIDHPDARLIAAAPDLLEACEKVKAHVDGYNIDGSRRLTEDDEETMHNWLIIADMVDAVIKKARGEE